MFSIDYQSREPIYEQLYNNVIKLLSLGVLEAGQQLPPVRQLAAQLGVNPNDKSVIFPLKMTELYIPWSVKAHLSLPILM